MRAIPTIAEQGNGGSDVEQGCSLTSDRIAADTEEKRVLESTLNRPSQQGKMTPDET